MGKPRYIAKHIKLNNLGENLKTLRESKGWTKRDLARRVHVTPVVIDRIENGGGCASVDTLQRLAKELGVLSSELLGEHRSPLTPRETQLVQLYRKLNVAMRRRYLYVGMALAGELDEDEEPLRESADWKRPTVDRDPVQEMLAKAREKGEKRPSIEKVEALAVELGFAPKPDGSRNPYPGVEVHRKRMLEIRQETDDEPRAA